MLDPLATYDVVQRDEPRPMTFDETVAAVAEHDVFLPTLGDSFAAEAFGGDVRARLLASASDTTTSTSSRHDGRASPSPTRRAR